MSAHPNVHKTTATSNQQRLTKFFSTRYQSPLIPPPVQRRSFFCLALDWVRAPNQWPHFLLSDGERRIRFSTASKPCPVLHSCLFAPAHRMDCSDLRHVYHFDLHRVRFAEPDSQICPPSESSTQTECGRLGVLLMD